jgi:hypothetical protein
VVAVAQRLDRGLDDMLRRRKSGWPMPRLMMSLPCAASAVARASTAKAFSSPMRSKAATVWSILLVQTGSLIWTRHLKASAVLSNRKEDFVSPKI